MIVAMVRIRIKETLAYRAEFLLWLVTLTLPLVMLVFWRSVAHEGAFKGYTPADFTAYYLAVLVATLLTSCNSIWEVNESIRTGELSFWLLRPVHPFVNFMAIAYGELGLRLCVALPILALAVALAPVEHTLALLRLIGLLVALVGGLLINQASQLLIGCLGFWLDRTLALFRLYSTASMVLSGAMFPLAFLPGWVGRVAQWLPFRFIIALPVEILTGKHGFFTVAKLLIVQASLASLMFIAALLVWRQGVRRYSAFG